MANEGTRSHHFQVLSPDHCPAQLAVPLMRLLKLLREMYLADLGFRLYNLPKLLPILSPVHVNSRTKKQL